MLQKLFCFSQVHEVAFSPSGDRLGMVSHGSIVSAATGGGELVSLRTEHLPFNSCVWLTEKSLVAAVSASFSDFVCISGIDGAVIKIYLQYYFGL